VIRLASGVALALFFIALTLLATPPVFFGFIGFLTLVCLVELFGMFRTGKAKHHALIGVVGSLSVSAAVLLGDMAVALAALVTVAAVALAAAALEQGVDAFETAANTLSGVWFVALPLASLALIFSAPHGPYYVLMIVAANTLCDTFAYYTGRAWGARKLAPAISPGKTVEGFMGGVAGAVIGAVGLKLLCMPMMAMTHAAAAGLIAGLIGPVGDLAESAIKRRMGVKDSGWIIPGHGGALDRVDSLLFSSGAFYVYLVIAAGS